MKIVFAVIATFLLLVSYQNCASDIDINELKKTLENGSNGSSSVGEDSSSEGSSDDSGSDSSSGGTDEGEDDSEQEETPDYSGFQLILPSSSPTEGDSNVIVSVGPYDSNYGVKFFLDGCNYNPAQEISPSIVNGVYRINVSCDEATSIGVTAHLVDSKGERLYTIAQNATLNFLAINVEELEGGVSFQSTSYSGNVDSEIILKVNVNSKLYNDDEYSLALDDISGCSLISQTGDQSVATMRITCSSVFGAKEIRVNASSRRYSASASTKLASTKVSLNDFEIIADKTYYSIDSSATVLGLTGHENHSNKIATGDVMWSLHGNSSDCEPEKEKHSLGACSLAVSNTTAGLSCSTRDRSTIYVCAKVNNAKVYGSATKSFAVKKKVISVSIGIQSSSNYYVDTNYSIAVSVSGLPSGVSASSLEYGYTLCNGSSRSGNLPSSYQSNLLSKTAKCSSTGRKYFHVHVKGTDVEGEAEISKVFESYPYVWNLVKTLVGSGGVTNLCNDSSKPSCEGEGDENNPSYTCCDGVVIIACDSLDLRSLGTESLSTNAIDCRGRTSTVCVNNRTDMISAAYRYSCEKQQAN
ncbi:MAG: hypothetical protein VX642_11910 [Bdellovibrionota bacterium]|nr:hypothetical protein [Bdellovibrionota bacterium]